MPDPTPNNSIPPVNLVCPHCEEKITVPDESLGLLPECVKCGRSNWVREKSYDFNTHSVKTRIMSLARPMFDEKGRFVPAWLAEKLLAQYAVKTNPQDEEVYVWNKETGLYGLGEAIIKEAAQQELGDQASNHRVRETLEFIKRATYDDMIEPAPNLVPVENGVLDLNKGILLNATSDDFFVTKLPVKYNPTADCPEIKKFMQEILPNEQDRENAWEIIAYCLLRSYPIQKGVMLIGEGSNGKSVYLGLINKFLGKENVCNLSLQNLCENRFSLLHVYQKYANIFADLPANKLKWVGYFKLLTGGDMIGAEKKFGGFINFQNYAKLLFSCNQLPESMDDTEAFYRRWVLITFPVKFEGDKADKNKLSKISLVDELSGLLNVCLSKLKVLIERGEFSYSTTTSQLREQYLRKSNPTAGFILDCLEEESGPDSFVQKNELYGAFVKYCQDNRLPTPTQDHFTKELKRQLGPKIIDERRTVGGKRALCWAGIVLKNGLPVSPVIPFSSPIIYSEKQEIQEQTTLSTPIEGGKAEAKIGKRYDSYDRYASVQKTTVLRWMSKEPLEKTEADIDQAFASGELPYWPGFDDWLEEKVKVGDIQRLAPGLFKLAPGRRYTEQLDEGV